MIKQTNRNLLHGFFHHHLGIKDSEDLRGCLYIPEEHLGKTMKMEHVAIGVAYNTFIGKTCCMHIVVQRPDLVSRAIVREMFEFPFIVCGCEAMFGLIDSTNEASLTFAKKVRSKEVHRVPGGGMEGDLVMMQMTRAECPWIRKTH